MKLWVAVMVVVDGSGISLVVQGPGLPSVQ
jgi:hypothetical protein